MNLKNTFLRSTLLLTFAGILSRLLGFYYRIFLANTIGAEGIGIYQLIFPIYGLCFALCASGIETSVSKLTAEKYALGKQEEALGILKTAITITLTLALSCSLVLFQYAEPIAYFFLKESRCTTLLRLLALTIPLGTVQSCICGYYFGIHQATIPSFAQLVEQGFRIGFTILLYNIYKVNSLPISSILAVAGLVIGEFCSLLFTLTCFSFQKKIQWHLHTSHFFTYLREIYSLAAPLTISRISITFLAGFEATLIPTALRNYGMDSSLALSIYGILNGMALPFILFPNALTISLSIMLLPKISEFQISGQKDKLNTTIKKTFSYCLFLGIFSLLFFLIFGDFLGNLVFSNALAGNFITILAWLCPFLYLNTTLNGILNGLGRADLTFFNGVFSQILRIIFIIFLIPEIGIKGYLLGILTSQLFVTLSSTFALRKFF